MEADHPNLDDRIVYPGAPVKISACPIRIWRPSPLIGQHNTEVYQDELGLSPSQLDDLKLQEII